MAVWFRRTYPASCEILGSEHLDEATPWVAIDWDDYEAVTRRLAARIAQDYLDERIMRVNGFVLSRTEAALHGVLVPWLGVSA